MTKYFYQIILFAIPFVFSNNCKAQVANYIFSNNYGTYTAITGGTLLGADTTDEGRFIDPAIPTGNLPSVLTGVGFPIGFNFTFNGNVFDRLAIQSNGWITLGQSALTPSINFGNNTTNNPISSTAATTPAQLANRISVFNRDLQGQAGSSLRLETIGTAPNRVCVIQWANFRRKNATGDNFNFQIRLYETTNFVEFSYGLIQTTSSGANTVQVGLRGTTNTDFHNRSNSFSTNLWDNTFRGSTNGANCAFSNTIRPSNGQIFRWTPGTCSSSLGLTVTSFTATTANFSWTTSLPNGQISVVPFAAAPGSGIIVPFSASTTANVTGLTPGTTYQVYLRADCGAGNFSDWSAPVTFTTSCVNQTIPWTEGFESTYIISTGSPLPNCWVKNASDFFTAHVNQSGNRIPRTGTKYMHVNNNTLAGTGDWCFTPSFSLNAGTTYTFSFYYIVDGQQGFDTLRVGVGNAQLPAAMTIIGVPKYNAINTTYVQYSVNYTPTVSGTFHFGVNVWATTQPSAMTFDDFSLQVAPTCPIPTNFLANNVTEVGANLSWTSNAPGSTWFVSTVPQGNAATMSGAISTTSNPFSLTSLNSNTAYSVYLREYCGIGDTSAWVGPVNFTTQCISAGQAGDTKASAITVNTLNYSTSGNTGGCFTNTIGNLAPDIWYRVVLDPCATGLTANVCTGSDFDTYLRVYAPNGTLLGFNDDYCGTKSQVTNVNVTWYDTVFVVVEGYGSGTGSFSLDIIQVLGTPVANVSYSQTTFCQGSNPVQVPTNIGSTGGEYRETTSTLTVNQSSGVVNLSNKPAGTYEVIYSVGRIGCLSEDTTYFTINAFDNANFSYDGSTSGSATVCKAVGSINPTVTGLSGGSFSAVSGTLSINSSTGEINTTTSPAGNSIIQYATNGACPNTATFNLTLVAVPNVSLSYSASPVCENESVTIFPSLSGGNGGSYTSTPGLALNGTNGTINVVNSDPGTYTVSYNQGGICPVLVNSPFIINAVSTSTDTQQACRSYTWINGVTYTSNNTSATHIVTNAVGCDSIITLNLTINNVSNTGVFPSGTSITASNLNATYVWLDCDNNYAVIPNETGVTFFASENGNYAVQLTENGCIDTSACVAITGVIDETSIENSNVLNFISIYPNPNNGKFYIDFGKIMENVQVNIVNSLGQIIVSKEIKLESEMDLEIDGAKGTYFIEIISSEGKLIEKLVVN